MKCECGVCVCVHERDTLRGIAKKKEAFSIGFGFAVCSLVTAKLLDPVSYCNPRSPVSTTGYGTALCRWN